MLLALVILILMIGQRGFYTFLDMGNVERVDPSEAKALLKQQELLILDVRSQEEYQVSHLAGAIRYQPELLDTLDRNTPVMVYCTISLRSNSLAKELSDLGHEQIYDLTGGLISWSNEEEQLINSKGQSTDSVHTYNRWFAFLLDNGKAVH